MSNIQIINPTNYSDWDDLILSTENYSIFHSSSWAKVLSESYRYKPLYFSVSEDNRLMGLIPLMEIRSPLTGRRGVSLPFSDHCEPIIADERQFEAMFDFIVKYGENHGWKYLELRGGGTKFEDLSPSSCYYGHVLDLTQYQEKTPRGFRDSTRRNIKRAVKEGVEIQICHSLDSVREFYRLHCMTRKWHGLPPPPFYFFGNVYKHLISKDHGIVVLASFNKEVIAGGVFFHFGERAVYKYGASDRNYQHLRANNLVMWEAIKWYLERDYVTFSFGRTSPQNKGLLQFKDGWDTKRRTIKYYKYNLLRKTFESQNPVEDQFSSRIFQKLPVPVLKMIGSLLYKHMA